MIEELPRRRLAAILAADVVGYSRMMGIDEVATLALLKARREAIVEPLVDRFEGRVFKLAGDAVLAEFASPVNAVACAVAVQAAMADANTGLAEARRIELRIGVNLGDVIVDGDDLYGDGVNVAARLEGIAEPGGVVISGTVHDHVRHKVRAGFDDLGALALKNIAEPVRAYRVVGQPEGAIAESAAADGRSTTGKPALAVMPFVNLSGEADQEYFADGMVEEIITGLSRLRWLTVIARNSTFAYKGRATDVRRVGQDLKVRYLLEGSVRKMAGSVRIAVQLIETEAAGHLWAERFDGALADIFDLQDRITAGVVGAIEPTVKQAEVARVRRKRPNDLDAYDLYLRALAHMYEVTPASRLAALDYTERALAIDPDYAEAHGIAAWCYFARNLWEGASPQSRREAALFHANAVQRLRTEDATTLAHAAIAAGLATRDYAAALEMIDRAIAINPSSVHAHGHGAVINLWAGNEDVAIRLAERALRLSPFDPLSVMPLAATAGARLMKGEYEAAIAAARRALQVYPTHTPSHLVTIVSLVRLDRLDEARAAAARFLASAPDYRIAPKAPIFENFLDELRRAELPD